MSDDYYSILGVDKSADKNKIKKAYRKLASQYHPDKQKGKTEEEAKEAEEKFKKINNAYEVLGDEEKKAEYDRFGHDMYVNGGGRQQAGGFGGFNPHDVFSQFFGAGGHQSQPRPATVRTKISINYWEAFKGCSKEVIFRVNRSCKPCSGKGYSSGGGETTCSRCNGFGQTVVNRGFFTMRQECSMCNGSGKTIANPCLSCHGRKVSLVNEKINITIPKGIQSGQTINLNNIGHYDPNSKSNSNVHVLIEFNDDALYQFRGPNMLCVVPISLKTAIYGGSVKVPTLHGEANLKIPKGTNTGAKFNLKGKGYSNGPNTSGYGDLIVVVEINLPKVSSDDTGEEFDESNFTYEQVNNFEEECKKVSERIK